MGGKRKTNTGTVRQRADGRWEGRIILNYDVYGKAVTKSVYGDTKAACLAKMKEVRESNGLLAEKIGPDMMFGTWLDYWYTFYIKPRVRKTTQGSYETAIYDHCIPHLGDIQLKKLTNNDLQQFYTRQKNNGRLRFVEKYGPQLSDRVIRHLHMIY